MVDGDHPRVAELGRGVGTLGLEQILSTDFSKRGVNFERTTAHVVPMSFLHLHLIGPFLRSQPPSLPFLLLPFPLTPEATPVRLVLRVARDPGPAQSGAHFCLPSGASQQHFALLGVLSTGLVDLPLGYVSFPDQMSHPSVLGRGLCRRAVAWAV